MKHQFGAAHYGPTIRQLRHRAGLGLREFASLIDVGPDGLSRCEVGALHNQTGKPARMSLVIYLQSLAVIRSVSAEKIVELRKLIEEIDSGIYG